MAKGEGGPYDWLCDTPSQNRGLGGSCAVTVLPPLVCLCLSVCSAAAYGALAAYQGRRERRQQNDELEGVEIGSREREEVRETPGATARLRWTCGLALSANVVASLVLDPWTNTDTAPSVSTAPPSIAAGLMWCCVAIFVAYTSRSLRRFPPLIPAVGGTAVAGRAYAIAAGAAGGSGAAFFVMQALVLVLDASVCVLGLPAGSGIADTLEERLLGWGGEGDGEFQGGRFGGEGRGGRARRGRAPEGVKWEEEILFPGVKGFGAGKDTVEWCREYWTMHRDLVERAKAIHDAGRKPALSAEEEEQRKKREDEDFRDSVAAVRRHVFDLCPKSLLLLGAFTSTCLTVSSFLLPLFQGKLFDSVLSAAHEKDPDMRRHLPFLLAVASLMLFNYLGTVAVGILFAVAAHTTVTRLRARLFANLMRQDIAFFDAHASGELSSRLLNDSARLQALAQFTTDTTLQSVVRLAGSLAAMFATHWGLALVATCVAPISWHLVRLTARTVGFYSAVQNDAMAKASALAVEALGAVRTVHANAGEEGESGAFRGRVNGFLRVIKFTVYVETLLRFTDKGLAQARDFTVLAIGMHQVVAGQLTIGGYTAFASYVAIYELGFSSMADLFINLKQTVASTGRFLQLLERQPEIDPEGGVVPADGCAGTVAFESVCFRYASNPDKIILHDISFKASPGTVTALVGESGAGKSTISRLVMRFYDPTSGKCTLDGRDYRLLSLRWLRTQVGFVEQEPVLFDRSLRENISYGAPNPPTDEQVREAAAKAHADAFIIEAEGAYDARPGEKGVRVSGGQKQRIAIARALIKNPKILLLDEATSALDSRTEHLVQGALKTLMKGKTTIVIAHRLSTVVGADQIIVMSRGHAVERGTHLDLSRDKDSVYASYMQHQLIPVLDPSLSPAASGGGASGKNVSGGGGVGGVGD